MHLPILAHTALGPLLKSRIYSAVSLYISFCSSTPERKLFGCFTSSSHALSPD